MRAGEGRVGGLEQDRLAEPRPGARSLGRPERQAPPRRAAGPRPRPARPAPPDAPPGRAAAPRSAPRRDSAAPAPRHAAAPGTRRRRRPTPSARRRTAHAPPRPRQDHHAQRCARGRCRPRRTRTSGNPVQGRRPQRCARIRLSASPATAHAPALAWRFRPVPRRSGSLPPHGPGPISAMALSRCPAAGPGRGACPIPAERPDRPRRRLTGPSLVRCDLRNGALNAAGDRRGRPPSLLLLADCLAVRCGNASHSWPGHSRSGPRRRTADERDYSDRGCGIPASSARTSVSRYRLWPPSVRMDVSFRPSPTASRSWDLRGTSWPPRPASEAVQFRVCVQTCVWPLLLDQYCDPAFCGFPWLRDGACRGCPIWPTETILPSPAVTSRPPGAKILRHMSPLVH